MTRKVLALMAALLMAAALGGPIAAEGDPNGDGYYVSPVVIGTQQAGTWGRDVDPDIHPIGDALAQDLLSATIGMPDEDTVEFVIEVTNLPANGGIPEVTRYTWDMLIDGQIAQLDGKWSNYSRGTCDPTSGQCDPAEGKMPRDPGMQPFFFRANLETIDVGIDFNAMEELEVIQGIFDPDTNTITVNVSVEAINKVDGVDDFGPCSTIRGGTGIFGGTVEAAPAAFVSYGAWPADVILATTVFRVPLPDDAEFDCEGNPIETPENE